ncbi:hypothetical protein K432DRAFT_67851 [Lepidopterella palustris CBS 459.81]|uniref:Uncharacterized protein n=1 Tax=Lepidopterella palustris CBS 459.81 TaxID=1314670 RepID=A0A8E2EJG3_9PEZI|nr:hypothetical protein K432DRAFT_67851 [Lepidopterella palustris CBS 459.81]
MYITSDLFLGAEAVPPKPTLSFANWDAMADWPASTPQSGNVSLGKRKRNFEAPSSEHSSVIDAPAYDQLSTQSIYAPTDPRHSLFRNRHSLPQNSNPAIFSFHTARLPSPPLDPACCDAMHLETSSSSLMDSQSLPLPLSFIDVDGPPPPKHRRRFHPTKLSRLTALPPTTQNPTRPSTSPTALAAADTKRAPDLRPCHICHKAPTRQRDLEGYSECRDCKERACQICTRMCVGGCGRKVCSTCCKEVGREGDTWCAACLG